MDKSLLELLEEEKNIVKKIRLLEDDINYFSECSLSSEYNGNSFEKVIDRLIKRLNEQEEKLLSIRNDIKKYLDFISSV